MRFVIIHVGLCLHNYFVNKEFFSINTCALIIIARAGRGANSPTCEQRASLSSARSLQNDRSAKASFFKELIEVLLDKNQFSIIQDCW